MHLLFCLDYYYPHLGGAEVLFTGLAEGLVAKGHRVQVVTQSLPGVPKHEIHHGVEIFRVTTHGSRYLFPLAALPIMKRLGTRADVIHTTTFAAAPPAWLAAKLTKKPLILTVHEVWVGKWHRVSDASPMSNWLNALAERALYLCDYQHYVPVSNATARDLKALGIPSEKITTIYNGVDYEFWNPQRYQPQNLKSSSQEFVFLFTGRPGVSKGLPDLLRAMKIVVSKRHNARLVALVSHAPAVRAGLKQAEAIIAQLQLAPYVSLRHPVPRKELPCVMLGADTVVVPSLSEGFGFVAAEACALERPVIATDNASLPEVVSGQYLLIPPHAPEKLAEAMLQAMDGKLERTPPKRFLLEDTLNRHLELYTRISAQA